MFGSFCERRFGVGCGMQCVENEGNGDPEDVQGEKSERGNECGRAREGCVEVDDGVEFGNAEDVDKVDAVVIERARCEERGGVGGTAEGELSELEEVEYEE